MYVLDLYSRDYEPQETTLRKALTKTRNLLKALKIAKMDRAFGELTAVVTVSLVRKYVMSKVGIKVIKALRTID